MPAQTIGIPPTVPQRVSLAIGNASKRTGVPFDYLMAQARVESSLDPEAQANSSSAAGLFQFTKQTWLATLSQHGANHGLQWAADAIRKGADGQYRVVDPQMREQILGLRFDPDVSSTMAAEFADDNADMREYVARLLSERFEVVDWKTSRAHDSDPLQLSIYRVAYAELQGVALEQVDAAFVYVTIDSLEGLLRMGGA